MSHRALGGAGGRSAVLPVVSVLLSMRRVLLLSLLLSLLRTAVLPSDALCAQADSTSTLYVLVGPSAYKYGCFDGCSCPDIVHDMRGTFQLVLVDIGPMYTDYRVEDFDAVVPADSLHLQGSGTYRVGGEVAVVQQMVLDVVAGGVPHHFDSGLVPGGGDFPAIRIDLPAHGFACRDTVLSIDAEPASAGILPGALRGRAEAVPNPFRSVLELRFDLPADGSIEAAVLDVSGRVVRRLARDEWMAAGPRTLVWDGRLDGGAPAPAGTYFAWIRTSGFEWRHRVVRIR